MSSKGNKWGAFVISLGLAAFAYWMLMPNLSATGDWDYHGDEGRWMASGDYYFQKFFVDRDWSYDTWRDDRFSSFGTWNPVIGKYIIGASLHLHGLGGRYTSLPPYYFEHNFAWNLAEGNVPPQNELVAARRPIAWMGILSTVLVFLLTRELSTSWLASLFAAVLFVVDPLVMLASRRAMIDMPALFFSLLALGTAWQMLTNILRCRWRQAIGWGIALGVSCGLCVGTKLNTILIVVVCGLWGVVNLFWLY